jgi:hypothetical protein
MLAMDMKGRGMYLSRSLSYAGAQFEVVEEKLSPEYSELYDLCTEIWADLYPAFEHMQSMILRE